MHKNKAITYEGRQMVGRPCAGQVRYVAAKHTALDGKVWWSIFDHKENGYVVQGEGGRYRTRKDCEYGIGWRLKKGCL